MKTILISALALGAMTSVAFAEAPLKPIAPQPMQLSLSQLDDVTAGGKKKRVKVNIVVLKDIKQENDADIDQEVKADDLKGNCKNCTVGSNTAVVDQRNNIRIDL
jgi:hypothetical protein